MSTGAAARSDLPIGTLKMSQTGRKSSRRIPGPDWEFVDGLEDGPDWVFVRVA